MAKKVLFILGTRPEVIKLAPLIAAMKENEHFEVTICNSGQHRELLEEHFKEFYLQADYDLDVMQQGQPLSSLAARLILGLGTTISQVLPDLVIVQGDTQTAFCGALTAAYAQIPCVHVEAGLRTYDKENPFPEELNRQAISRLASIHFCPTEKNKDYLLSEGITNNVFVTGNTVIDSLKRILGNDEIPERTNSILYTVHRRENINSVESIAGAITSMIQAFPDSTHEIIKHPNETTSQLIQILEHNEYSANLLQPLSYSEMVTKLSECQLVITDSGGILEECTYLKTPTIVIRKTTERQESLSQEWVAISNPEDHDLLDKAKSLLQKSIIHGQDSRCTVFGEGNTSTQIITHLEHLLGIQRT